MSRLCWCDRIKKIRNNSTARVQYPFSEESEATTVWTCPDLTIGSCHGTSGAKKFALERGFKKPNATPVSKSRAAGNHKLEVDFWNQAILQGQNAPPLSLSSINCLPCLLIAGKEMMASHAPLRSMSNRHLLKANNSQCSMLIHFQLQVGKWKEKTEISMFSYHFCPIFCDFLLQECRVASGICRCRARWMKMKGEVCPWQNRWRKHRDKHTLSTPQPSP